MRRALPIVLAALWASLAGAAFAAPPGIDVIREAVRADDVERADRLLMDLLVDGQPDPLRLAELGLLAQEVEASTAISEVRRQATALTEGVADAPPAARIARGYAALGMAIYYWRNQMQGSSIPLLFDEALAMGATPADDPLLADLGALLLARAHAAQGTTAEAATALAARRAAGAPPTRLTPLLALSEARLLYDLGAAAPLDATGRPLPEAAAQLATAADLFRQHGDDLDGLPMRPAKRDELAARAAWTLHRLGRSEEAGAAYARLHARGGTNRTLAIRGLQSLWAYDGEALRAALTAIAVEAGREGTAAYDALVGLWLGAGRLVPALDHAQARLALDEGDPAGWVTAAAVFEAMDQPEEAIRHLERALRLEPGRRDAIVRFDALARSLLEADPERTIAWYERLVAVCPQDPFLWNNLAFMLREQVAPHTLTEEGGLQRLVEDAPPKVRAQLTRCVEAYARAVALIDPEEDGLREVEQDWNLATVVNDYGLMLHYFVDVQDAPRAEALYLRALRMTDDGYKDSYVPNLQRLYAFVLPDRELAWYRAAVRAADGLLREAPREDGTFDLVPDDGKRAAAAEDAARLKARILQELGFDDPETLDAAHEAPAGATDR